MNDILYLVHASKNYDKSWNELKPSPIEQIKDQFPGVYFTLITKDNLQKENLFGYGTLLIFSKKLLEQENYHINLMDYNGFINEKNTYFPWNLEKAVKKIKSNAKNEKKYNPGNEVIFHDAIPMKYLCLIIETKTIDSMIYLNKNISMASIILPNYELYNEEPPDKTKLPFFCNPFEDNFTGYNKLKLSSSKFYKAMAILSNVNKNQSRKKIIEEIKTKVHELYNNREKQNIEGFKLFYSSAPLKRKPFQPLVS